MTTGISHPLNLPPVVDLESYEFTVKAYENRGYIDYGIHAGGTAGNCSLIEQLWTDTGATSIKMFMCFSVAEFPYEMCIRDSAGGVWKMVVSAQRRHISGKLLAVY